MSAFLAFRTAAFSLLRPKVKHLSRSHDILVRNAHQAASSIVHPKNEDIPHSIVQLVDPETGRLMEPVRLRSILRSIDKKKEYVELVSVDPMPIVKIVDKKEAFVKRKLAKEKAKVVAKKNVQKEVQLTWGAASGDTNHKLSRVREDLEKGIRVDLVYSLKKGQVPPTPDEMKERMKETAAIFADVSKEWKPPEFRPPFIAAIFLQGNEIPEPEIQLENMAPKKQQRKQQARMREEARKKSKNDKYDDAGAHILSSVVGDFL